MNTQTSIAILTSSIDIEFATGLIHGAPVVDDTRTLKDLVGVFEDEKSFNSMDPAIVVYSVSSVFPVSQGVEGGLFYGTTSIRSGSVGGEYFMTKGHFHSKIDTAEFYWGIRGEGILLLMDEDRSIRAEKVIPGSLHYIPGRTAHRMVNTGDEVFVFGACWPSDAGHNYGKIHQEGFSARVKRGEEGPMVVGV
jgi:glucose-6-phosphate isomerase